MSTDRGADQRAPLAGSASFVRRAARRLLRACTGTDVELLRQQVQFLMAELEHSRRHERRQKLDAPASPSSDAEQTKEAFDYQWHDFAYGVAMPDDREFMRGIEQRIVEMTDTPAEWFRGKRVVDAGCGCGRYTYGFLRLGARVLACDQSRWALERTKALCAEYASQLETRQIDLLDWDDPLEADLVFSFGVVDHTGNTYRAIRNLARKVRPGGQLFLMVYGFPQTLGDFAEENSYIAVRNELRGLPLAEKKQALVARFGERVAHGWFDAVAPEINDLLTFDELHDLLTGLGYSAVRRTQGGRHHNVVARRAA